MTQLRLWAPALLFGLGSLLISGVRGQQRLELEEDALASAVPREILGMESRDGTLPESEVEVAGMDRYLFRIYGEPDPSSIAGIPGFTLYVGFYGSQAQGRTIHSPKNCMPGSGWEALHDREASIATSMGEVPVNRYVLQRDDERVLVLYWYQGRGRVQANEYLVKLDLLRDSALHGRSDEALVRIVVPIESSEAAAFTVAEEIAAEVIPAVDSALPDL